MGRYVAAVAEEDLLFKLVVSLVLSATRAFVHPFVGWAAVAVPRAVALGSWAGGGGSVLIDVVFPVQDLSSDCPGLEPLLLPLGGVAVGCGVDEMFFLLLYLISFFV